MMKFDAHKYSNTKKKKALDRPNSATFRLNNIACANGSLRAAHRDTSSMQHGRSFGCFLGFLV